MDINQIYFKIFILPIWRKHFLWLWYHPFHKTLPRSSACVNWISVRFYETGCIERLADAGNKAGKTEIKVQLLIKSTRTIVLSSNKLNSIFNNKNVNENLPKINYKSCEFCLQLLINRGCIKILEGGGN